ncbi:MAG: PHP domain-containing protein [Desulfobulbaceae bacterium]|nr:PHP domain-containing protein [Desulfobulbaceae bacterium]
MCVDLHTHSIYSDGTATPAEIVDLAAAKKLHAVSLTDHDTVAGVFEAVKQGRETGITVVPGLEVSAVHRTFSLHILGYGIDPTNLKLTNRLGELQDGRRERNRNILDKLQRLGISLTLDEVERFSHCGQTGRPHIAKLLMHKGIVKTMDQAFKNYLGRGKPAWSSRFCYSAAETIDIIHAAGGVAVLAHPGQLDPAMKVQPRLIAELVERGLDGLEIFYPTHTKKMKKRLLELAARYNLLATGGSDYHGANRSGKGLAGGRNPLCPPDSILDSLQQRQLQPVG